MRHRQIWLHRQGISIRDKRFVAPTVSRQRIAQIVVRLGLPGVGHDGLLKRVDRLVWLVHLLKRGSEVVVRLRVVRLQRNHCAVSGGRVGKLHLLVQDRAQVVAGRYVGRLERSGAPARVGRFVEA